MTRSIATLAILSALIIFEPCARAQKASCTSRTVAVSVLSKDLLPVSGITPSDLKAKIGGKPVPIISISPDQRPHRIVILLDSSGSMRSRWPTVVSLAESLVDEDANGAQFALMTFNRSVTHTVRFEQGNAAVRKELGVIATNEYRQTEVQGMTASFDAIESAIQLFDKSTSADSIYLITDGDDNSSRYEPDFVKRSLVGSGVRLFATIVSSSELAGPTPVDPRRLELLAMPKDSGGEILGQILWIRGEPELVANSGESIGRPVNDAFSHFFQRFLDDEAVEVNIPPSNGIKPEHLKLGLTGPARKRWEGSQIVYPQLLAGCSAK